MKFLIKNIIYLIVFFSFATSAVERQGDNCTTVQELYKFNNETIISVDKYSSLLPQLGLTEQFELVNYEGFEVQVPKLKSSIKKNIFGITTLYTPDEKTIIHLTKTNLDDVAYFSGRLKLDNLEQIISSVATAFDCENSSKNDVEYYVRDMIVFNMFLSNGLRQKDFKYYEGKFKIGLLQINKNYSKLFTRVLVESNTLINLEITVIK